MSEDVTYKLTLTSKQAKLLSHACDVYSRLLTGQWDKLCDEVRWDHAVDYVDHKDEVKNLLMKARAAVWPSLGVASGYSWGVGHFKDADMLWEIHQVLRNKIAWSEYPDGGFTVDFSTPMSISGEELPRCELEHKA